MGSPFSEDTPTQPYGTGPDEFLKHVREVLAAARPKLERLNRLVAKAELLEIGLVSWKTSHVRPVDRARDIEDVFKLRDVAKKEGLIP